MENKLQKTTRSPFTLLNNSWNNAWLHPLSYMPEAGMTVPAVNIREDNDRFWVEVAVPGKQKEDFKIKVENNSLTISSEETEETPQEGRFSRREFRYNSFSRSFTLPKSADPDKISAKYENGVLNILIPKKESEVITHISIEVE